MSGKHSPDTEYGNPVTPGSTQKEYRYPSPMSHPSLNMTVPMKRREERKLLRQRQQQLQKQNSMRPPPPVMDRGYYEEHHGGPAPGAMSPVEYQGYYEDPKGFPSPYSPVPARMEGGPYQEDYHSDSSSSRHIRQISHLPVSHTPEQNVIRWSRGSRGSDTTDRPSPLVVSKSNSYGYEEPYSPKPIRPLPVRPPYSPSPHSTTPFSASSASSDHYYNPHVYRPPHSFDSEDNYGPPDVNVISPHRKHQESHHHRMPSDSSSILDFKTPYRYPPSSPVARVPLVADSFDSHYSQDTYDLSNPNPDEKHPVLTEDSSAPVVPPGEEPVCKDTNEVNSDDVLCGRGGGTNSQVGNRRFRKLVQDHQPIYLTAKRKEKPIIARNIVRIIRKRGGRFLKKDEKSEALIEVGDERAEAKTSQALREGLDVRATKNAATSLKDAKKKKDERSETPKVGNLDGKMAGEMFCAKRKWSERVVVKTEEDKRLFMEFSPPPSKVKRGGDERCVQPRAEYQSVRQYGPRGEDYEGYEDYHPQDPAYSQNPNHMHPPEDYMSPRNHYDPTRQHYGQPMDAYQYPPDGYQQHIEGYGPPPQNPDYSHPPAHDYPEPYPEDRKMAAAESPNPDGFYNVGPVPLSPNRWSAV